jgi:hypothetical protein
LENKSYRQMAKEAGISLGAVNWIINDLKSLGHLVDFGARGRRLVNRKELLKRWTSAYPEQLRPKLILGRFKTEHAHDWWKKAEFWKFDHWDEKDLQTAPPLLVYADLLSKADDRCLETAEIIYEQYIARLVE